MGIYDGKEPQIHQCHLQVPPPVAHKSISATSKYHLQLCPNPVVPPQWCPNPSVPPPRVASAWRGPLVLPALSKPHPSTSHQAAPWWPSTNQGAAPDPRRASGGKGRCIHASTCVAITTGEQEACRQQECALESARTSSVHLSLVINGWWAPHGPQ